MKGYTASTVAKVINRVWTGADRDAARGILDLVSGHGDSTAKARLQLAAIKLSASDLSDLRRWVLAANGDYRDVLMAAEYPAQLQAKPSSSDDPAQLGLVEADLEQYRSWLASVGADEIEPAP